jgi:hypothetical protein
MTGELLLYPGSEFFLKQLVLLASENIIISKESEG